MCHSYNLFCLENLIHQKFNIKKVFYNKWYDCFRFGSRTDVPSGGSRRRSGPKVIPTTPTWDHPPRPSHPLYRAHSRTSASACASPSTSGTRCHPHPCSSATLRSSRGRPSSATLRTRLPPPSRASWRTSRPPSAPSSPPPPHTVHPARSRR